MDRIFNKMDKVIETYENNLLEEKKELHIIAIATVFYIVLAFITFVNFIF